MAQWIHSTYSIATILQEPQLKNYLEVQSQQNAGAENSSCQLYMAIAHLERPTELLLDNSVLVSSYILTLANLRENITFHHHQSVEVSLYTLYILSKIP